MTKSVRAGRAEVEVALRDRIAESLPGLERRLKATGARIALVGAAVSGAAAAGLGLFSAAAKSFGDAGTELVNLSVQTGASVQTLSALEYAAARTGASMSDVQEILTAIREGRAIELWGTKSAGVLRLMRSNLGGLIGEAYQLGAVLDRQDAAAAVELSSALATSGYMLTALWRTVGAVIAPAVTESVQRMTSLLGPLLEMISSNAELVRVLFAVISVVSVVGTALAAFGAIVAGAGTALAFLAGAFLPLMAGAGILMAIGVAAWRFRDQLLGAWKSVTASLAPVIEGLQRVYRVFQETFSGILMALGSGQLGAAADIAWLGFKAAAWSAIEELATAIDVGLGYLQAWFPAIDTLRDYFRDQFDAIGQAILAGRWDLAGKIVMGKLRLAWQEGIDWLKDGWSGLTAGLVSAFRWVTDTIADLWHKATGGIAKGIAWVMEKLGLAEEGTLDTLAEDQDRARKQRERERSQRSDPWDEAGQATLARQEARQQLQRDLQEMEQQAAQAYDEAGAPTIAAVAEDARKQLQDAIAAAEKARAERQKGPGLDEFPMGRAGQAKSDTRGTFSAVAAAMMGLGREDRAPQETAQHTRDMNKHLARIADQTRPGAVV